MADISFVGLQPGFSGRSGQICILILHDETSEGCGVVQGGSGDPIVNSSASRLYRLSARQYVHAYLIPCGRETASLYYSVQYGVRVRVRTCVACAAPTWDRGAGRRIIELDRAAIQLSAAVPTDAAGGVGSQYDWR